MKLTLNAKGTLAFIALAAYVALVGFVLAVEREKLLEVTVGLEQIYIQDRDLGRTDDAIHSSLVRIQTHLYAQNQVASLADDVALDIELVQSGLQGLQKHFPGFDVDADRLREQIAQLRSSTSRSALITLQTTLSALATRLTELAQRIVGERQAQWEAYYRTYDRMTFITVTALLLGAILFGTVVTMFFSRLTWDIGRLGARAEGVIAGYRGAPLQITREDEIGGLMKAVNRMQTELRRHEQQLELVRQQRFHQEKMAAIGSIAAAVTHEINNPIAAIAGIARSLSEAGRPGEAADDEFRGTGPQLILQQTERISQISRQISEFARPHSPKPELTDLNRLAQGICRFTGYDKRLRAVDLVLDLDETLPAAVCVADHVTQVLMNLLINAGDAVAGIPGRKPQIRVQTGRAGAHAFVAVHDNGHGMGSEVMEHAFDEGFSTKAEGQGLGLGLFLCKALVDGYGGTITLASEPGQGTSVTFTVPLQPA